MYYKRHHDCHHHKNPGSFLYLIYEYYHFNTIKMELATYSTGRSTNYHGGEYSLISTFRNVVIPAKRAFCPQASYVNPVRAS